VTRNGPPRGGAAAPTTGMVSGDSTVPHAVARARYARGARILPPMRFAMMRAWQAEACRSLRAGAADLLRDLALWGRPDEAGNMRADELDEATIAARAGVSVPTVKRRVAALRAAGLVDVSRDLDPATGWLGHNRYRLVPLGEWRLRNPERWAAIRGHLSSVSPGITDDPTKAKPVTGREIHPRPSCDERCECGGTGWRPTVELWPRGRTGALDPVEVVIPCPGPGRRAG
jgi:DNA-binding transcriptional ArsR family regulator